jgi:hypothetical protein
LRDAAEKEVQIMMDVIDMTDVLGLAALGHDLDPLPVVGLPQAQGDLIVLPWPEGVAPRDRAAAAASAVPVLRPEVVVRGNGGNEHTLVDPDGCGLSWAASAGQTVGTLVVPEGGRACLDHAEHGRLAVGAGVWVIRRQRDQADVVRLVAD